MTLVRPARADDAPALEPLFRAFFAEDRIPVSPDLAMNLLAMLADDRARIWVLEVDGAAQGLASAALTRGVEFGLSAEIEDLYVTPAHRGQGHARALIEAAIAWCEARGAREIGLVIAPEAEAAQGLSRFYGRFGFTDSGRRVFYRDAE